MDPALGGPKSPRLGAGTSDLTDHPPPPRPTEKDWPHADCHGSRGARNREGGLSSLSQGRGTPAKTMAAPC